MGSQGAIVPADQELAKLVVRVVTDPAGKAITPPIPRLYVAIHVGRSVYMDCERDGKKHSGWGVHGDIDIVPAGTKAIWEPRDHDTALVLGVEDQLLWRAAEEYGLQPARLEMINRFQIRDAQLENIGWALKAEMEGGYPSGRIFMDSMATALAARLVRRHSSLANAQTNEKASMSGKRLRQVLSHIEDNLNRDLSLTEISVVAGVSVSHCKTIFRQAMGVPVHQYVIQRRVERARALLCESEMGISQIAQQTGFAHQSHLTSHMRRILGTSPRMVRAMNR